jgi:hypothetical protein
MAPPFRTRPGLSSYLRPCFTLFPSASLPIRTPPPSSHLSTLPFAVARMAVHVSAISRPSPGVSAPTQPFPPTYLPFPTPLSATSQPCPLILPVNAAVRRCVDGGTCSCRFHVAPAVSIPSRPFHHIPTISDTPMLIQPPMAPFHHRQPRPIPSPTITPRPVPILSYLDSPVHHGRHCLTSRGFVQAPLAPVLHPAPSYQRFQAQHLVFHPPTARLTTRRPAPSPPLCLGTAPAVSRTKPAVWPPIALSRLHRPLTTSSTRFKYGTSSFEDGTWCFPTLALLRSPPLVLSRPHSPF